jgi:hypothetical protein
MEEQRDRRRKLMGGAGDPTDSAGDSAMRKAMSGNIPADAVPPADAP